MRLAPLCHAECVSHVSFADDATSPRKMPHIYTLTHTHTCVTILCMSPFAVRCDAMLSFEMLMIPIVMSARGTRERCDIKNAKLTHRQRSHCETRPRHKITRQAYIVVMQINVREDTTQTHRRTAAHKTQGAERQITCSGFRGASTERERVKGTNVPEVLVYRGVVLAIPQRKRKRSGKITSHEHNTYTHTHLL